MVLPAESRATPIVNRAWPRRASSLALSVLATCLAGSCGGSGAPRARVAPFLAFDRLIAPEDPEPGSGLVESWDVWTRFGSDPPVRITAPDATHGWSFSPAVSPDGTRIAFVGADPASGHTHLFTMRSNGFSVKQISSGEWNDESPCWSPDGLNLAFASDRNGVWSIWICTADGVVLGPITKPPLGSEGDHRPAWCSDLAHIAFERDAAGHAEIWTVLAWGAGATRLTTWGGTDADPAWRADGKKIAFVSDRLAPGAGLRVFQMNPDGSGVALTDSVPIDGVTTHANPTWTADGSRLYLVERWEPGGIQGSQDVVSMKADGTDFRFEVGAVLPGELHDPDVHP